MSEQEGLNRSVERIHQCLPQHVIEELAAFKLRGELSTLSFYSQLWSVMPSLGWKYRTADGGYVSPNGVRFASSKEAVEILDLFALSSEGQGLYLDTPPKSSQNVQRLLTAHWQHRLDSCQDPIPSASIKEWVRKLQVTRDQLLEAVFYNQSEFRANGDKADRTVQPQEKQPTLFTLDDEDSSKYDDAKKTDSTSFEENVHRFTNSRRATAIDAGAEQYFSKKTQRMKRKFIQSERDPSTHIDQGQDNDHDIKMNNLFNSKEAGVIWPNPQDCVENILSTLTTHVNELDEACLQREKDLYHSQFKEWSFLLTTNHSILLYGFGSKRLVLNNFTEMELSKRGHVLSLNGYDRDITLEGILDVMVQSFLDGVEPQIDDKKDFSRLETHHPSLHRSVLISKTLAMKRPCLPIYLVIHNIDGISLRDSMSQSALSLLVSYSQVRTTSTTVDDSEHRLHLEAPRAIRLIASVDHLNASAVLWKAETELNYNWVWKLVNSHRPYYQEVSNGVVDTSRKLKSCQSNFVDTAFMERVIRSIAPRHAEIVHQLAEMQLEKNSPTVSSSLSSQSSTDNYVEYKLWKKRCFEKLFIGKESDLQNMMRELIDHGILECKTDEKTYIEIVGIPIGKDQLRDLLEITKVKKNSR